MRASNPHLRRGRVLSPLHIPISPTGHYFWLRALKIEFISPVAYETASDNQPAARNCICAPASQLSRLVALPTSKRVPPVCVNSPSGTHTMSSLGVFAELCALVRFVSDPQVSKEVPSTLNEGPHVSCSGRGELPALPVLREELGGGCP